MYKCQLVIKAIEASDQFGPEKERLTTSCRSEF